MIYTNAWYTFPVSWVILNTGTHQAVPVHPFEFLGSEDFQEAVMPQPHDSIGHIMGVITLSISMSRAAR